MAKTRKSWDIGNTTIRNPNRIERALAAFYDEGFSGNVESKDRQEKLIDKFDELGILDYGELKKEDKELNGRKWRSAFYQLGFITGNDYLINGKTLTSTEVLKGLGLGEDHEYSITPAGRKLIEVSKNQVVPEIEEIYLRQFLCYQLPNALEPKFDQTKKFKPFVLFLQVLFKLRQEGLDGLNKLETEIFIQYFFDQIANIVDQIVSEIKKFRNLTEGKPPKERIPVIKDYLKKRYDEVELNVESRSLRDYADTTFRYFYLSGLLTRIGDRITIRSNKIDFVSELLNSEPVFVFSNDPMKYFYYFYTNSYPLPTDNKEFALKEVKLLAGVIKDKKNLLLSEAEALTTEKELSEINATRYRLVEYHNWEREEDFANEQQTEEAVKDIISYLKVLNNETVADAPTIDDKPAYLEWAVWRSFLSIDKIVGEIHKTRRFPIDEDFLPRNTAPGHGSDLIFEFESYVLVVEVTLTISHRQMAVESEPVRRHTVQYKQEFPNKDVYCLFIAPSVDNNVVETFRIGVWYKLDEEEFVNIVPMSLSDFIGAISTLLHKKFHNDDFRNLLDRCLTTRNVRAPQWKKSISKEVNEWTKRIVAAK